MLNKSDFIEKCELWRQRTVQRGIYSDIYDGHIWKDFMSHNGIPFLSAPFNYAFHLNVDWFQPFDHTQHSEGAIYLSILNLPREVRFLKENILLVGIIPGPREPQLTINTFLEPLVAELNQLWAGVSMRTSNGLTVIVRAALLCVGCDIPAARKVCGFLGHRATMGCSKCLLSFPTKNFGEKPDYSNFDRNLWHPRTDEFHRTEAEKWYKCNTQSDRNEIEKRTGVRYSCLLKLPYFNAPRMCIIDPMHNILLGTAKLMIELWKPLITPQAFDIIQSRVDSFVCPNDVGRIPSKISSSCSGFTAEQWKNWTMYFSLFALKGILPRKDYDCWLLFVKACTKICRRTITSDELREGDELLMEFCQTFVKVYDSTLCTMNMHLHGHLCQCIADYGPVYSFWCFSFERLNGILGSYHTNNHHISVQLTRRFLDSKVYAPDNWPQQYVKEFLPLLQHCNYNKGSLMQITLESSIAHEVCPLPPIKECAFFQWQLEDLQQLLNSNEAGKKYSVLTLHHQCQAIMLGGHSQHVLGAQNSRHSRSSFVLAKHNHSEEIGLASIAFFSQCTALDEQQQQSTLWVAGVSWYISHQCKVWFGHPTQVWTNSTHPGINFIPVCNIKSRVVYAKSCVDFGRAIGEANVNVVVPLSL